MYQSESEQYGRACVVIEPGDSLADVIEMADEIGARFWEDPEDEEASFVVEIRGDGVGPELYTREALARSIPSVDEQTPQLDQMEGKL